MDEHESQRLDKLAKDTGVLQLNDSILKQFDKKIRAVVTPLMSKELQLLLKESVLFSSEEQSSSSEVHHPFY